jgi:hypothetical protein
MRTQLSEEDVQQAKALAAFYTNVADTRGRILWSSIQDHKLHRIENSDTPNMASDIDEYYVESYDNDKVWVYRDKNNQLKVTADEQEYDVLEKEGYELTEYVLP